MPGAARWTLTRGPQVAVVDAVGAALHEYRVGDRDVVVPVGADEVPPGIDGAVLVPWVNRIRDGRYDFGGATHHLPLTEPERGNAVHGLGVWERWTLTGLRTDTVTARLDLAPRPGYPWALRCEVTYGLEDAGLTVTSVTENRGEAPAPLAVGFHPWLSPGGHRLDDCTLRIDASGWVRCDDRLLPVAEEDGLPAELDFRTPRRLGTTRMDTAFTGVPEGGVVRLADPDGFEITVSQGVGLGCWQLFTGDGMPGARHRAGLAVEPMSAVADAFRSGRRLVVLRPGQSHRTTHAITTRRRTDD